MPIIVVIYPAMTINLEATKSLHNDVKLEVYHLGFAVAYTQD